MKKIIAIFVLIIASNAYSQTGLDNKIQDLVFKSVDLATGVEVGKYVDGSPYLVKDFLMGKVEGFPDFYQIRYNAYLDEVQFKKDNKIMAFLKEEKYGTIKFTDTNETLKLANYKYENNSVLGYLFVIADTGNVKIYRKSSVTFQDFKVAKNSYETDSPANFRRAPDVYFVQRGTAGIVELPSNKKQLIELFPDKKEEIKNYLKDNKLDYNTKNNVQKLAAIL